MTKTQLIEQTIKPVITAMGFDFVGIEFLSQGRYSTLRVYVDHPDGVTLDNCSKLSEQLSAVLDVEELITGQYNLEVSSPGLDRPLFTLEQFKQFIGHIANIRLMAPLNGQRRFKGIIKGVKQNSVILLIDEEEVALPFDSIAKAHLVYLGSVRK